MPIHLPPRETLNRLLRYEPDTGALFWNARSVSDFITDGHTAAHTCAKWNSRWAGKEALTKLNLGYRCGRLNYQYVLAHRVIWKMMTGEDAVEVDHIDGDRANNRWGNLRNVSSAVNKRNASRRSDNTSGVTGVIWHKARQRWVAQMHMGGKIHHIGVFVRLEDAISARKDAEAFYRFHPNHGRDPAKT